MAVRASRDAFGEIFTYGFLEVSSRQWSMDDDKAYPMDKLVVNKKSG
jgi:hypothetical protein